jgi:UDP-N-acetylglucosamine 4-epimerase
MSQFDEICANLKESPKKWVVTGAAGFIGTNLSLKLLKLNQKVIAIDNFSTGSKANIDEVKKLKSKKYKFIKGDVQNYAFCKKTLRGADFVLHQAAIGSVPRSIKDPIYSHESNVNGFITILKAAVDCKIKKFVYASSSSVYGDHPALPKKEENVGNLLSPYAATKAIDELYAHVFARIYKTPCIGLRYFNVFGPRQSPKGPYAAVIPLWIDAMVKNKDVIVNGDGSYSRDFCYIDNVVQANILSALADKAADNRVYNIAYGDRTTLLELFNYLKKALEEHAKDRQIKPAIHRAFRKGDIPHSHADISLAQKYLGYAPTVRVGDGLKRTVEFILKS